MFDNLAEQLNALFRVHGFDLLLVLLLTLFTATILDWLIKRQLKLIKARRSTLMFRWFPLLRLLVWTIGILTASGIVLNFSAKEFIFLTIPFVLAFGLATRDLFSNLLGGAVLAIDRRFEVGSVIRVGEVEGEVRTIGLRSVHILSVNGHEVEIPNKTFLTNASSNITPDLADIQTRISMVLPGSTQVAHARQIAYLAAAVSRYASPRRTPEVFIDTHFDQDFLLRLTILGYVFDPAYEDHFRSDVVEIIHNNLHEESHAPEPKSPPSAIE